MGFLDWLKGRKSKDTEHISKIQAPDPERLPLGPELSKRINIMKDKRKVIIKIINEYHSKAIKLIQPIEREIKLLIQKAYGWGGLVLIGSYPGKQLSDFISKEAQQLGLSEESLPMCFALVPFYQYSKAEDHKNRNPFSSDEKRNLSIALTALLSGRNINLSYSEKLAKILIDCLFFRCFDSEIYHLNKEIVEKLGGGAWSRLGLRESIGDPITPFFFEKSRLDILLPEPDQLALQLGRLGNENAITILREARKLFCHSIYHEHPFFVALCKLNCQQELEELKTKLSSGEVENDLIISIGMALLYSPPIVELLTILSNESSHSIIKPNAKKILGEYDNFTKEVIEK